MTSDQPDSKHVVLVTGGQGFLGQHIIRCLQENDDRVKEIRVLDIQPFSNRIGFQENKPLKSFVGDVRKPESLHHVFAGVDCVFHVAGLTGFAEFPSLPELEDVNVNGTRNVIHLCISNNVPKLVYTSTTHVAVPRQGPLILVTESKTPVPPKEGFLFNNYAKTKYDAECLVKEANGKRLVNGNGHLSTICLRPTLLYGELDPYYVTHALKLAHKHGNRLYRIGWGGERSQVTYAGNAAWAHISAKNQLFENPKEVEGEVIFITDDTPVKNPYAFLEPFLKARYMKLSSIQFPAVLALIFVYLLYVVLKFLKPVIKISNPFPHPATVYFVCCLYYFDRLKATLRLGYKPIYDPEEAFKKSLEYYSKIPLS